MQHRRQIARNVRVAASRMGPNRNDVVVATILTTFLLISAEARYLQKLEQIGYGRESWMRHRQRRQPRKPSATRSLSPSLQPPSLPPASSMGGLEDDSAPGTISTPPYFVVSLSDFGTLDA